MRRHAPLLPLALMLTTATTLAEAPPVFSDLGYNEAIDRSIDEDKLLLVDATAVWCGPCQRMDETTWIDPGVVDWINENAIAIQVDVDEQEDIARGLRIRAMPTMIAFLEGEEVDRVVGYRDADATLEWLENVAAGKTQRAALLERAGDGPTDMQERMDIARKLMDAGEYDKATSEYAWLWNNMVDFDPAMVGVRLSFLLSEIESLIRVHEPARETFEQIRRDTEKRLRAGEADMMALMDWARLSSALGHEDDIIAWYDRIKDDPGADMSIRMLQMDLLEILLERERYADAGRALAQPVQQVEQAARTTDMSLDRINRDLPEAIRKQTRRAELEYLVQTAARNYALCLAADRDQDAAAIEKIIADRDSAATIRLGMIDWALRVGEPRPQHLEWLNAIDTPRANALRPRVRAALDDRE